MNFINTEKAPNAIGPYSQAVESNGFVYLSGQIPLDPQTMELVQGGVEEQTEQVFKNLKHVLNEADLELGNIVKAEVFLKDIGDFSKVNKVYEKWMNGHKPARQAIGGLDLPKNSLIEISIIASR